MDLKSRVNTSMRTSPMRWTGISTIAGLLLGLIGRLLRARANRAMPELVILNRG